MKNVVKIFICLFLCVVLSSCVNRCKFDLTIANYGGKSLYVVKDNKLSGELVFDDNSYLRGYFKVYYDEELLIEEKLINGLRVEQNGETNIVWETPGGKCVYGNYMAIGDEKNGDSMFFVGVIESDGVSFTFFKRGS